MRSGMPKSGQDTFLLINENEAWKGFPGFSNPGDAYIVLVDAKGAVLARVPGTTPDPSATTTFNYYV